MIRLSSKLFDYQWKCRVEDVDIEDVYVMKVPLILAGGVRRENVFVKLFLLAAATIVDRGSVSVLKCVHLLDVVLVDVRDVFVSKHALHLVVMIVDKYSVYVRESVVIHVLDVDVKGAFVRK